MQAPQHFAVIMAGGAGTRFWPLSRAEKPKQFLPLGQGGESLLQSAVRRLRGVVEDTHIYGVTSERHAQASRDQLPQIPANNILAEPQGRNTAPCVAWAAAHIRRRDPQGLIAVLPADPHIGDEPAYKAVLKRALEAAGDGSLVTVGVQPTRPETGYGYVELGEQRGPGVFDVRRFVEKPDRARAEHFLQAGNFLWNSGMFFFRVDTVLDEVRKHLPELHTFVGDCDAAARQGREQALVQERYAGLPSISIDYGVMERADQIRVVPGDFGWHDIGSWTTAWELSNKDERGNATAAPAVLLDAERCYVHSRGGKLVALIGLKDLVVVDTDDALLVMPRERAQDVKSIVAELKRREDSDHL